MSELTRTKRLAAASTAVVLSGLGIVVGAEIATAQGGLVDTDALLRLLGFFDLGPF